MANINLTTSYESDIFIDVELKIMKSKGYKISRVDFINYLIEEISKDEKLSDNVRKKINKKIKNIIIQKDNKLNKIIGGL